MNLSASDDNVSPPGHVKEGGASDDRQGGRWSVDRARQFEEAYDSLRRVAYRASQTGNELTVEFERPE